MVQLDVTDISLCGQKTNYCLQQITVCVRHACKHTKPLIVCILNAIWGWETVSICQMNLSIFDFKQWRPRSWNQRLRSNEISLRPLLWKLNGLIGLNHQMQNLSLFLPFFKCSAKLQVKLPSTGHLDYFKVNYVMFWIVYVLLILTNRIKKNILT